MLLISKRAVSLLYFLFFLSIAGVLGCADAQVQDSGKIPFEQSARPRQKVFSENYDDVWRAAQLAMSKYPIRTNDIDAGVLESDFIRGEQAWTPPHQKKPVLGGTKYKVVVNVLRGKMDSRQANKVTVIKYGEHQKDFFSEPERLPTDGLEELSIIYRIERELAIQKLVRKNSK